MDFGLSEEQVLLEKTIRAFLADTVPIERVRELRDRDCPNDREIWRSLAELGVTGILVPESEGGSDLTLLDAALVGQSLGHAVTPTAFLSSGVIVPIALREVDRSTSDPWLQGLATGDLEIGVAFMELFSIREDAVSRMKANAELLTAELAEKNIVIEGHCDERGTQSYNMVLGEARANAVKTFLEDLGISSDKLQVVSYGKEKPFCKEQTEECWQENRRGHFVIK